jgi:phosphate starvation-inducible PhoH-like protein
VQEILEGVDDIAFLHLNAEDVVRNRLVGEIVTAYGRWDESGKNEPHGNRTLKRI